MSENPEWRCATCKHWLPDMIPGHGHEGECVLISDYDRKSTDPARVISHDGWSGTLCTLATFGCLEWAAKT